MPIQIRPYEIVDVEAVRNFNQRLLAGGENYFQFPKSPIPEWLPPQPGRDLYREYFLARDGSAVRGGYILKHQPFVLCGQTVSVGNYQLPLSEGIVDPRYRLVGFQLLRDALRRQPMLYALGMGGLEKPLPTMLKAAGWTIAEVPFFFRVCHPAAFLRNIAPLRRSPKMRALADFTAATGIGHLSITLLHHLLDQESHRRGYASHEVDHFSESTDALWLQCRDSYPFSAVRDSASLNYLYPPEESRFLHLEIYKNNRLAGWVVLLDTMMRAHNYFGNLRVGTLVDCMAHADSYAGVVSAAYHFLAARGVDLVISNQLHAGWGRALRQSGFLSGPSNFILALSPHLSAALPPLPESLQRIHMNRGDGDGPIHL